MRNKAFGAIPSPPDGRDYHVAMLARMLREFPEEFMIHYAGEIKDQGSIGTCVAQSLAYAREIAEERQSGVYKRFSAGFIYGNRYGTLSELFPYEEGMYPRDALHNLLHVGDVLYEDFPTEDKVPVVMQLVKSDMESLYRKAAPYRISAYCRLYTVDEIKTALMELGAVSVMYELYESFYQVGKDGFVPLRKPGERFIGRHQMTIVGWRQNHWIVLNSWGKEWGDNGLCYIPFDYPFVEAWSMTDNIVPDTMSFIEEIKSGAISEYRKHGIFSSVTIAQAILESNWGRSGLAIEANNLFGIKWTEGCGYDYAEYPTWEYVNGQWVKVMAKFRKYKDWNESIADHSNLLLKPRYKPVLDSKDYKEACVQLQKCGYATDPNYPEKLISLIEKHKLYEYDTEGYRMYKDYDKIDPCARKAVEDITKLGIMIGTDTGNFNPKHSVTREQLAIVAHRIIKAIREKKI